MRVTATILILLAVVLTGCVAQQTGTSRVISEAEARQCAADHVNTEFKGHVWKTGIGDRTFRNMSPEDWFVVKVEETRILLQRGGRNGQEFTVSMNLDGTNVKVLKHSYATR